MRFHDEACAVNSVTPVSGGLLRGWVTSEWAEHWHDAQLQLKVTTLSGYRHSRDKHVLPLWKSVRLVEVGHADVQAWVTTPSRHLAPS